MKAFWITGLVLIAIVTSAYAENIRIAWNFDDDPDVTSFTIFERTDQGSTAVVEGIVPTAREMTFEDTLVAGMCKTYYVQAFNETLGGVPSDGISWCNDEITLPPLVVRPGSVINLVIEVTD